MSNHLTFSPSMPDTPFTCMASKFLMKKAHVPNLVLCLFSFFLLNSILQAQSLKRHVVTKIQEEGTLYFINPLIDFKGDKSVMSYDITYLTGHDSATFNFTYFTKNLHQIDSILLAGDNASYKIPVTKLFVDNRKNKWEHRYSARLPMENLQEFFTNEKQGSVFLLNAKSDEKQYSQSKGKWKRQKELLTKIFDLIQANS